MSKHETATFDFAIKGELWRFVIIRISNSKFRADVAIPALKRMWGSTAIYPTLQQAMEAAVEWIGMLYRTEIHPTENSTLHVGDLQLGGPYMGYFDFPY